MAETKTNGGSAFPVFTPDMNLGDDAGPGMSLRDWFAGQALAGMITADRKSKEGEDGDTARPRLAAAAYQMADAMLAERSKP